MQKFSFKEQKILNDNIHAKLFYVDNDKPKPLIVFFAFQDEGKNLYSECLQKVHTDFALLSIHTDNWNKNLSPWKVEDDKLNLHFAGNADALLYTLTTHILPQVYQKISSITEILLCGFSLAGLFSLYAVTKVDTFTKVICTSGSFWFPGSIEYFAQNKVSSSIQQIYMALGDKEDRTTNATLSNVLINTQEIFNILKEQIPNTSFNLVPGNHYKNIILRLVNGIKFVLDE